MNVSKVDHKKYHLIRHIVLSEHSFKPLELSLCPVKKSLQLVQLVVYKHFSAKPVELEVNDHWWSTEYKVRNSRFGQANILNQRLSCTFFFRSAQMDIVVQKK